MKPTILRQFISRLDLQHLQSSLAVDDIPDQVDPRPSSGGRPCLRIALVVRLEPQDPTTRFEGARAGAVGTFYQCHPALQKTLEVNGKHHPRKRAFGCRADLNLVSYGVAGCPTLHPCVTMRAWMYVKQWLGGTRSIGARGFSRLGPRNGNRLSEQLPEFLLALSFSLVHFEFPGAGLPFHPRSQSGRQGMLLQGIDR